MSHVVLTAADHRDLRVRTDRGPGFGDAIMAAIAVPSEFRRVQTEYPILFRLDRTRDTCAAIALFGFETGENLFLDGARWDARYRPLAIDIQPFLIGQTQADSDDKQVHIDIASPRLGADGVRIFDEDGQPTRYFESVMERLQALDEGFMASADFFTALRRHDLLEPLTFETTFDDGSTHRLVGFHVIDEERLQTLDPAAIAELHDDGHLMPIFMALASLGNIGDLVARKNRRMRRV